MRKTIITTPKRSRPIRPKTNVPVPASSVATSPKTRASDPGGLKQQENVPAPKNGPAFFDMSALGGEELVLKLASESNKESTRAAIEIFKRGESIIPYLLTMKGKKSIYQGNCLNDVVAGMGITRPNDETEPEDADPDNGWYVTAEVASIYLVSAIYYDNLTFAQIPYLKGAEDVEGRRYNTPIRVHTAWDATEKWYAKLKSEGMEKLRKDKEFPLKSSGIRFYGTADTNNKRTLPECRHKT